MTLPECREEALEEKEVRAVWTVEQSAIWRPRLREADSRGFWDTPACRDRMFEADWARACNKEKFATMMARENKNSKVRKVSGWAVHQTQEAVSVCHIGMHVGATVCVVFGFTCQSRSTVLACSDRVGDAGTTG